MSELSTFSATLEPRGGYQFDVVFDQPEWAPLRTDEPAPLGDGQGPNPSRLLAAAMANCLAASLQFCLEKSRVPLDGVQARVTGTMGRNERGRLRIASMDVVLEPALGEGVDPKRLARCRELFEDFCVVTQSVREGIDVNVEVEPRG